MKKLLLLATTFIFLGANAQSNVGIGTSSPASKLDVKGNATIGNTYSGTAAPANGAIIEGTVGIGTSAPDISSAIDIASTSKGALFPRMTLAQRNAIGSPATSLLIYQTDNTPGIYINNGTSGTPNWQKLSDASGTLSGLSVSSPITSTGGSSPTIGLGVVPVSLGGTGLTVIGAGKIPIGVGPTSYINDVIGSGTGINVVSTSGSIVVNNTGDLNTTNEGSLTVGAGTATTSCTSIDPR